MNRPKLKKLLAIQMGDQLNNINEILSSKEIQDTILDSLNLIIKTFRSGNQLFVCGNGGSAADALHITGELVGKFLLNRKGFRVVCLNSNIATITAWANDFSYATVFSRQIEALGKRGDLLLCISTSGNSESIISATKMAKLLNIKTIGLTGETGGKLRAASDLCIRVPSDITPRIQESHVQIYHFLCEQIEKELSMS